MSQNKDPIVENISKIIQDTKQMIDKQVREELYWQRRERIADLKNLKRAERIAIGLCIAITIFFLLFFLTELFDSYARNL